MRRLTVTMAAMALLLEAAVLIVACSTPEAREREVAAQKLDRRAVVEKYAADLNLTVVAVVCVGYEHHADTGIRRDRCDLRTKEAGVLPLVCNSACRLLD